MLHYKTSVFTPRFLAFHGSEDHKDAIINRVRQHIEDGSLRLNVAAGWNGIFGCDNGVTLHAFHTDRTRNARMFEQELGFPGWTAMIRESIFEGFTDDLTAAQQFTLLAHMLTPTGAILDNLHVGFIQDILQRLRHHAEEGSLAWVQLDKAIGGYRSTSVGSPQTNEWWENLHKNALILSRSLPVEMDRKLTGIASQAAKVMLASDDLDTVNDFFSPVFTGRYVPLITLRDLFLKNLGKVTQATQQEIDIYNETRLANTAMVAA